MLPLMLTIVVFLTVVVVVFSLGAAVVTPSSVLGARLRALGGQQQQQVQEKPARVSAKLVTSTIISARDFCWLSSDLRE